jgi:hypothetical protein
MGRRRTEANVDRFDRKQLRGETGKEKKRKEQEMPIFNAMRNLFPLHFTHQRLSAPRTRVPCVSWQSRNPPPS